VSRDKAFSFLSLFLNVTQISIAYCFSYCRAVPLNVELEASALIINLFSPMRIALLMKDLHPEELVQNIF